MVWRQESPRRFLHPWKLSYTSDKKQRRDASLEEKETAMRQTRRRHPMGAKSAVVGEYKVDMDEEDADEDADAADSTTTIAAPHATTVGR